MLASDITPKALALRLESVFGQLQEARRKALPPGVGLDQAKLLMALSNGPVIRSIDLLCQGFTHPQVFDIVIAHSDSKILVESRWLSPEKDTYEIQLTKLGRFVCESISTSQAEAVDAFFAALSKAGREDLAAALSVLASGAAKDGGVDG